MLYIVNFNGSHSLFPLWLRFLQLLMTLTWNNRLSVFPAVTYAWCCQSGTLLHVCLTLTDGAVPYSQVYDADEQSIQIPKAGPKDKISVQARDRYYNSSWSEWSALCR